MPTLYNHPISQHCRRVLALLNEAGIAVDIRHVSLDTGEHMSAEYLAKRATVDQWRAREREKTETKEQRQKG